MYSTPATIAAVADWLLRTTWQAGVLVVIVGAMHLLGGRRLAAKWRFALWGVVVVRLLLPGTPTSPWSVFNVVPPALSGGTVHSHLQRRSLDVAGIPTAPAVAASHPDPAVQAPPEMRRGSDSDTGTGAILLAAGSPAPAHAPPEAIGASSAPVAVRGTSARTFPTDWRLALLTVWLAGVAVVALRVIAGTTALRRRLRHAPVPPPDVVRLLDRCRGEMGVGAPLPVLLTDAVAGPALFGFLRPMLLLPPALLERLDASELRFVFLHELAHVKRRDPLTNAALLVAGALHWFNPLALLAVTRCRVERELACDELVMRANAPAAGPAYGRAVLRVADALCAARAGGGRAAAAPSVGLIPARSQLRRRIAMISTFRDDAPVTARRAALPLLLLLGVCSCALTDRREPATAPVAEAPAGPPAGLMDRFRQEAPDDAELVKAEPEQSFGRPAWRFTYTEAGEEQSMVFDEATGRPREVPMSGGKPKAYGLFGAVDAATGAAEAPDPLASPAAADDQAERQLRAMLERTIPELKFEDKPLEQVLDFLRDVTKVNMHVDWKALEAAGVKRETPVSIRTGNVQFGRSLRLVLDEAGGQHVLLDYMVDANLLLISTADVLDRRRPLLTRVYDVRDLIMPVHDFTGAPKLGVAGPAPAPAAGPAAAATTQPAGASPAKDRSRVELVEEVTTLIKETVDPDSWRDNGGSVGGLRELQGQLIITQRPENHAQVVALLEQLRETRSIQVAVEARFVSFDIEALPADVREQVRQTFDRDGKAAPAFLTDEAAAAVLRGAAGAEHADVLTAPRLTLFNGQRAYVVVANNTEYVAGYAAVERNGERRFEPQRGRVTSGVVLDVAATASADRRHVTLSLRPQLARLEGMRSVPFDAGNDNPAAKGLTVQVPHVVEQSLETIVNVPDRTTLLLGGFVQSEDGGDDRVGGEDDKGGKAKPVARPVRDVFLLVRPTLIDTSAARQ